MSILTAATYLLRQGDVEFHGFRIAKAVQEDTGASDLIGHGTLYKALGRLEQMGMLVSRWEDPAIAAADGDSDRPRPVRRLYHLTAAGQHALAAAITVADRPGGRMVGPLAPVPR